MKGKLYRIILALSILVGAAGVAAVQEVTTAEPAAAQSSYKKWETWVGGMYHNWFVRVEQFPDGGMYLNAWRLPYEHPYDFNYAIREIRAHARSHACFRILGGGHNVQPAKIQIVPNGLYAGGSCDADEVDGQWHPNLGYCFGDDAAFTHAGRFYGWEDGYTCPYPDGSGWYEYGYWAPLDTSQDPRFTPGYHTWRIH